MVQFFKKRSNTIRHLLRVSVCGPQAQDNSRKVRNILMSQYSYVFLCRNFDWLRPVWKFCWMIDEDGKCNGLYTPVLQVGRGYTGIIITVESGDISSFSSSLTFPPPPLYNTTHWSPAHVLIQFRALDFRCTFQTAVLLECRHIPLDHV